MFSLLRANGCIMVEFHIRQGVFCNSVELTLLLQNLRERMARNEKPQSTTPKNKKRQNQPSSTWSFFKPLRPVYQANDTFFEAPMGQFLGKGPRMWSHRQRKNQLHLTTLLTSKNTICPLTFSSSIFLFLSSLSSYSCSVALHRRHLSRHPSRHGCDKKPDVFPPATPQLPQSPLAPPI